MYAKKNDWVIVGCYHANARTEDNVLPETTIKLAETIKKNNEDKAIIFLVKKKDDDDTEKKKN